MRALESPVVVLVHPDDDNREMHATFLRQHGFAVLAFAGATDALGLAPLADIIVTGIHLRGAMDGVQLIARIRCDERTRHTPIIVVTASPPARYKPYAEAAGCDRFLLLPCLPQDLLHEIEKLVPPRVAENTLVAALLPCGRNGNENGCVDSVGGRSNAAARPGECPTS